MLICSSSVPLSSGLGYVPVRFLGNALGVFDSNIEWNTRTRTATLQGINKLDLSIDKQAIIVNDNEWMMVTLLPMNLPLVVKHIISHLKSGMVVTFDVYEKINGVEVKVDTIVETL
ncbi:MAG TPA: stalk domain-containing protein [Syntrophomonadaceae bacterium]|nr:stalk domain-containing protein [Syntrophomonadaceae bacterium]